MFSKTVDGVLSALNKAITDLDVVATKQEGLASGKEEEAAKLLYDARLAKAEATRAKRVKEKLEALVE